MNINRLVATVLLSLAMCGNLSAQVIVSDLSDEIDAGRVNLVSAAGNGSSSGASVEAFLVNETAIDKYLAVNLSRPIYLVNSGAGQNMVASQVYLGDGGYVSDGERSFIILKPRERTRVLFIAYCVDFERDNPSESDSFSIGVLPANLNSVMANVNALVAANPDADVTAAIQVAIWLAEGDTVTEIQSKFDFTPADERLARNLIEWSWNGVQLTPRSLP